MIRSLGVLILIAILGSAGSAAQADSILSPELVEGSKGAGGLPPLTVPDCLGVNIHFTGTEAEQVAKIADEGFGFIRMDFAWSDIEKKKGDYDFSKYDELVDSLASKHIRPLFILDYANKFYDGGASPYTDEGRAAFVKFAAAGVARFKGKGALWEIWNEPNGGFWRPKTDIEAYVKLCKVVYPALKKADPDCTVLAPALAGWNYPYIENAFKLGLLEATDVVSVHPYTPGSPEIAVAYYARIRELIAKYAPKGREYPVVSSEWGYSSWSKGVTLETQADYIARQFLSNMMNDIRVSIWYDWRNDGLHPSENERNFGTVYYEDLKPKPAFFAAKTLMTELNGYSYANRIRIGGGEDYLALFKKGDDYRLAAWTTGDSHTITLPFDLNEVEIVSQFGERTKVEVKKDKLELKLTQSPQYIEPSGKSLRWAAEAGWKVEAKAVIGDHGIELHVTTVESPEVVKQYKAQMIPEQDDWYGAFLGIQGDGIHARSGIDPVSGKDFVVAYDYPGQSKPLVTVSLLVSGMHAEPLVRVVELDASACPRLEVMPSAGRDIIVAVHRPEVSAKEAYKGSVTIGNPEGIQLEKDNVPFTFAAGQTRALVHFTAVRQPSSVFAFSCSLYDTNVYRVMRTPAKQYSMVESFADGKAGDVVLKYLVQLDGDAKVPAEAKLTYCKAPAGAPADICAKLDYKFDNGWKFARIAQGLPIPILDKPLYARAWVKGDGGKEQGRLRIRDAGGQMFQMNFGVLDFSDWRCIEADVTNTGSHWDGKDDGIIAYPVKWDTLFILDNVSKDAAKGTVYLGPIMLYYE